MTEISHGAFYGCSNLKSVVADPRTKINARAFLNYSDADSIPLDEIKERKLGINFLWLNRELNPSQRLIFKEDWTDFKSSGVSVGSRDENYGELLNAAFSWQKTNPDSMVTIWYDGFVTTTTQVSNTKEEILKLTGDGTQIQLKDIRALPIVSQNKYIFSDKTGFYFKIDLLKLIITHNALSVENYDYAVYSDLGVKPMSEEKLFDETATAAIENYGILTNDNENQFIQAENSSEVVKSLALIINANLQRCYQGLQCVDYELRRFLLCKLFRAVYYDTTHTLHFLCYGFKNGEMLINDYDEATPEIENWVEYNPKVYGHMPLGNFYISKGAYNLFKRINSSYKNLASFKESFDRDGDKPKNLFKFSGVVKHDLHGEMYFLLNKETSLEKVLESMNARRGSRSDIEVPKARDHMDSIPKKFVAPEFALAILPVDGSCLASGISAEEPYFPSRYAFFDEPIKLSVQTQLVIERCGTL